MTWGASRLTASKIEKSPVSIANTALLGAFAALVDVVSLENVECPCGAIDMVAEAI